MIDILQSLDKRAAIGALARAALSLDGLNNPAAQAKLDDEATIRERILAVARERAGLAPEDNSAEALERIGDVLDEAADRLLERM